MSIWDDTLRYKNMVWTRTYKCASTYSLHLLKSLGFEKTNIDDVTKDDKIFTMIREPHTRRIKGIAECLFEYNCIDKLLDEKFLNLIKDLTVLDQHTLPYSVQYKNFKNRILFIPIDCDKMDLDSILKLFFKVHCPELVDKEWRQDLPREGRYDDYHNGPTIRGLRPRVHEQLKNHLNDEIGDLVLKEDSEIWKSACDMISNNLDKYITYKFK